MYHIVWNSFCPDQPLRGREVDHIDQDHTNDFLYNLRPATRQQQALKPAAGGVWSTGAQAHQQGFSVRGCHGGPGPELPVTRRQVST